MALAIQWTRTADKKFASIIEHLDKEWGEITVRKFVKKVDNFLEILSQFPEIGSTENSEKNIRGFVITKQTTIFYRIKKDKIILLNLFDNRQHPSGKLYK